jgi:ribose/xylose/arabinose/galactoside ABC-type transport system permease subunit
MSARVLIQKFQRPLILLVLVVVLTLLQPDAFATVSNFKSIFLAISIYGVMVSGSIFTILLGGIDLAVGAVAALSGACTVLTIIAFNYSDIGVILGILAGLLAGCFVGLMHGVIISKFRVPAFLITVATMNIVYGAAELLTGNQTINIISPASFTFVGGGQLFGIPFPIYIVALMAFLSFIILNMTVFGRQVYATGGNPVAASLSGVPVFRTTCAAYIISGFTAAAAGIVLASMNQQAISKAAQGYENDVLTAIVVGGTSLMGGEGSIQGAIFGALLVGILNNGLRLMGVSSIYHTLVKGIIIIIAVSFDFYSRNRNSGLLRTGRLRLWMARQVAILMKEEKHQP